MHLVWAPAAFRSWELCSTQFGHRALHLCSARESILNPDSTMDLFFLDRVHYIVQDIPSAARSHHGTAEVAEDGSIGLQPEKLCNRPTARETMYITFRTWPSLAPKDYFEKQ